MHVIKRFLAVLTFSIALLAPSAHAAQYTYDQLGRLTSVVESDGSSITYTYDANGNMLSITRTGGTPPLAISSFLPASGAVGTAVTIRGVGFSSVPGQNAVSFNGQAATVTSSNASTLIATVPAGATSGLISVSVNGNTATSVSTFMVTTVEIIDFSPQIGSVGTQVVIDGNGFDPLPAGNTVRFNSTAAVVTAASTTQLTVTVPSQASSGRISVTAPAGSAASEDDFVIPPQGFTGGQVAAVGRHEDPSVGRIYTVNSTSKIAMVLFDAVAGQRVSVVVTNNSMRGTWRLYAPDGTQFTSGNVYNSSEVLDVGPLPTAGTYSFVILPTISPGSATIRVNPEYVGALQTNGTALPMALAAGQNAELTFTAVVGESYNFILHNYTASASTNTDVEVFRPDGTRLIACWSMSGGSTSCHFNADVAGAYRLRINPQGLSATTFDARLSTDFRLTMTSGVPSDLELAVPGRTAILEFSVSAGQAISVSVSSINYTSTGSSSRLYIYDSAGLEAVPWISTTDPHVTANLPSLPAGNYRAWFVPQNSATATFRVQMEALTPATLLPNGVASNFTAAVPAQIVYHYFSATQGQNLALGFTNISFLPGGPGFVWLRVVQPGGAVLYQPPCDISVGRCQLSMRNLPVTGTYRVELGTPAAQRISAATTLSQSVTGTLTQGTPLPVTLTYPGQSALLTFNNSTTKTLALSIGSMSLTPAGGPVDVRVYNAAGTQVGYAASSTTAAIPLPNLAAGIYTIQIAPTNAATGTVQALISQGTPLPVDGSSSTFTAGGAGEKAYFTFPGTAGQSVGIGITGLSLSPASPSYVTVQAFRPDNTTILTEYCYTANTGCLPALRNLPTTGTYRIEVTPGASQVMSFNVRLVPVSVTSITPSATAIPISFATPGQFADYSFTATAGQYATLRLAGMAMSPANSELYLRVFNPSGTQVGSAAVTSTPTTLNLTDLVAGTYRVTVVPTYAATGTAQITFAPPLTGTLASNGTTANYSTATAGQKGYFTFAGTAGQNLGVGLTGIALTPSSPNYTMLRVFKPDNSQLGTESCYTTNNGCQILMRSLPTTGTYRVEVEPTLQQSANYALTLSQSLGGAISPSNTPIALNFGARGQNAVYTFTATAGQAVTLRLDSLAMTPANNEVYLRLINPSGGTVNFFAATSAPSTLNVTGLVAGTHTITIVPTYAATGSAQFTFAPPYTGSLVNNGSPASFTTPVAGQFASLSFSVNAGDNLGIGFTGMSLTPNSPNYAGLKVLKPDNSTVTSTTCYLTFTGCQLTLRNAPSTGTYRLQIEPLLQQTISFNATLSQSVTGVLAAGTPLPITLSSAGQMAVVTFTATAGQTVPITLGSLAMSPAGSQLNMLVYGPTGTLLDTANATTSSITRNLNNLAAGTYTIFVVPTYAATGSFQLSRP